MSGMHGTVHIARPVLGEIVALTALGTPGVAKLHRRGRLAGLRRGDRSQGVRLRLRGGAVEANLAIVVESAVNMHEVGRAVQQNVTRALQDMAGLEVRAVNVVIQDIEGTT